MLPVAMTVKKCPYAAGLAVIKVVFDEPTCPVILAGRAGVPGSGRQRERLRAEK